jgi:hypothetical protein
MKQYRHEYNLQFIFTSSVWIFLLWEFNLQYRQYQMCRAKDINFLSKETLCKICNYMVNHVSCVHCCTFLNFLWVLRRFWRLVGDCECWMQESERGIDWRHVQVLSHTGKWENLKLHQLRDSLRSWNSGFSRNQIIYRRNSLIYVNLIFISKA